MSQNIDMPSFCEEIAQRLSALDSRDWEYRHDTVIRRHRRFDEYGVNYDQKDRQSYLLESDPYRILVYPIGKNHVAFEGRCEFEYNEYHDPYPDSSIFKHLGSYYDAPASKLTLDKGPAGIAQVLAAKFIARYVSFYDLALMDFTAIAKFKGSFAFLMEGLGYNVSSYNHKGKANVIVSRTAVEMADLRISQRVSVTFQDLLISDVSDVFNNR